MTSPNRAFVMERLQGDWREMQRIRCARLFWYAKGRPPTEYTVTYGLTTFVSPTQVRGAHRLRFTLGPTYPMHAPQVVLLDRPLVFHPNVYADGRVCIGGGAWCPEEGLASVVHRVARMLLYFPIVTNVGSAANPAAVAWYLANRSRFPLEPQFTLPDPITGAALPRRRLFIRRWRRR